MAVIRTKRNMVCAYEPDPDDLFVKTYLTGTEERYQLMAQPISEYQATVDWAVSIADQFTCPIEVVPVTADEVPKKQRVVQ